MRYFYYLIIVLAFSALEAKGQHYNWRTEIPEVSEKGYYEIILSPEIIGHLNKNFYDIRIIDENNEEVPYIINRALRMVEGNDFFNHTISETNLKKGCCSYVVIHNPDKQALDGIILRIKSADVTKKVKISGSNDSNNWFVIKENHFLSDLSAPGKVMVEKPIYFPMTDYEFIKIDMNDSLSAPINILEAGDYTRHTKTGEYIQLQQASISKTDSAKKTYLDIQFPQTYFIDQFTFKITAPEKYMRAATIYTKDLSDKTGETYFRVGSFNLNSESNNKIPTESLKSQKLRIIIDNKDNPPLAIENIEWEQLKTFLKAELVPGKKYNIFFGDENAKAPDYDLKYYAAQIPASIPSLSVSGLVKIDREEIPKVVTEPLFQNPWFIWSSIGFVICLFGFMTYRMVNDMKKE